MERHHGTRRELSDTIEAVALRLACSCDPDSVRYSRNFAGLLALLLPRIARLIRQYRLEDMRDDAQQAAAIGVHRALISFDPEKARFSTHVTWQIKGELQSLRYRMRLDQRASARKAGVRTVSLEAFDAGDGEGRRGGVELIDDHAERRTEAGASEAMAIGMLGGLLDRLDAPGDERAIVFDYVMSREPAPGSHHGRSSEQRRQIVRRTMRNCAKVMVV